MCVPEIFAYLLRAKKRKRKKSHIISAGTLDFDEGTPKHLWTFVAKIFFFCYFHRQHTTTSHNSLFRRYDHNTLAASLPGKPLKPESLWAIAAAYLAPS